jgi:serine/threonine protein kinase
MTKSSPPAFLPTRFRPMAHMADTHMSSVWLTVETLAPGITRLVVIKALHGHVQRDGERRTMFFDEARILAHLTHPHVVQLLAAGETDTGSYLVLEYVPGGSIERWIERGRNSGKALPRQVALRLLLDVADALSYVHQARDAIGRPLRVIHRDLNPANVLVGHHGGIKLIDFGIASAEARLHETVTGTFKGTEGYMAPEQLRTGAPFDHRVDVYAFGVLCYELLAGVHPFGGARMANMKLIALDRRVEVPARVASLVERCLALEASDRPPTMEAVALELRDAAGHVTSASEVAAALRDLEGRS